MDTSLLQAALSFVAREPGILATIELDRGRAPQLVERQLSRARACDPGARGESVEIRPRVSQSPCAVSLGASSVSGPSFTARELVGSGWCVGGA
jgi:uncharacterized protein (DUF3084 family)